MSYEGLEEDDENARKNERTNPAQKSASRLPVNSRFQKPNYVQEIRRKEDAQLYDSFDSSFSEEERESDRKDEDAESEQDGGEQHQDRYLRILKEGGENKPKPAAKKSWIDSNRSRYDSNPAGKTPGELRNEEIYYRKKK